MSDDDARTPDADDRGRDERIGDLLEVPSLDEVTRRRLVGRALAAAPGAPAERPTRSRLALAVPVAAAIAVGLVIGAVVVTRPEDTTPTAAPAPSSTPTPQGDGERAAGADDAPALAPAESTGITDLGNLGTVTNAEDLRTTAVVAQEQLAAPGTSQGRMLPCTETPPADLGLATIDAAGSATVDDAPVTILLGRAADGVSSAVALTVEDCAPVLRTTLGSTLPGP
jgi:hypothetical protein